MKLECFLNKFNIKIIIKTLDISVLNYDNDHAAKYSIEKRRIMKKLLLCAFLGISSLVNAGDYFYFWADSYEAPLGSDGSTFVLMNLKTSQTKKFDIIVNEKIIAKDYTVFENEITQFPITVSKKFTVEKYLNVCALMQDEKVQFQNVVCAKIELVK